MTALFGYSPGPFRRYLGAEEKILMLLLIPVALTGLGVLCLVYCSVPLWFVQNVDISIGMFFLPAALVLLVSEITAVFRTKL